MRHNRPTIKYRTIREAVTHRLDTRGWSPHQLWLLLPRVEGKAICDYDTILRFINGRKDRPPSSVKIEILDAIFTALSLEVHGL